MRSDSGSGAIRWLSSQALLLVLAGLLADPALAAPPNPVNQERLDRTVRYLQEAQRPDGGFGNAGAEPSQDFSAWVAFALAATGINPQDQARPGGVDAYTFLVDNFRQGGATEYCAAICTTTFERELLVVDAAGTDPHDFAGYDLVAEILARQLPDGSFSYVLEGGGEVNDTIFAILALSPLREPTAQAAVQRGVEWLLTQQNGDGGWNWGAKGDPSEVDMTAAAVEALNAAGSNGGEAQRQAFAYLHAAQNPDGGFPEEPGDPESNVASTAWTVQAIWSAGQNPETWRTGSGGESEEPLDFMASLLQPDGQARWEKSNDANGVWMTAQVAPAFAGQALPISPVPRAAPTPPPSSEPGQGGESPQPGEGVIAGGGGRGAPLFSRPRPQSKGRTPGGARIVYDPDKHPTDHSETRRGADTKQPNGTAKAESAPAEVEPEVSGAGVGSGGQGPGSGPSGSGQGASGAAAAGAGPKSPGRGTGGTGSLSSEPLADAPGEGAGREVSGALIGAPAAAADNSPAFGAPGLHSAGAGAARAAWPAIAIAAAALLAGFLGAALERGRHFNRYPEQMTTAPGELSL